MKKRLINFFSLVLLATATFSCEKEYDNNNLAPLAPSFAEIPVTVSNADFFERFPVVVVKGNPAAAPVTPPAQPVPGTALPTAAVPGEFTISFTIPADKGTIKSIDRVATGVNGLATLQSGTAASQLNYNGTVVTPITGNGSNTISFTSSLLAYTNYRTRVGAGAGNAATINTATSTPQAPNQLLYYFQMTITTPQGDIQIIPAPVRVRIVQ